MKTLIIFLAVICLLFSLCGPSYAYLIQFMTYKDFFDRADIVVIATPMESKVFGKQLPIEAPENIKAEIDTIDTKFIVAQVLKGGLTSHTFHFLHLNRKDRKDIIPLFGAIGTFFINFEKKENKEKSYILFMKRIEENYFAPAWVYMEGSRAIIPVKKDGGL